MNSLGPNLQISHDWEYRYASVGHRYLKVSGVDQKTSQYLVWPPFASCSVTHQLLIEVIRLLVVACGMLPQSSSMAVRSCWILAGLGTRCCTHQSRASQTCSMGDLSSEYAGHGRIGTFSASWNCVQILAVHYHGEIRGDGGGWMARQWTSGSHHSICIFKLASIKCNCFRCL